MSKDSQHMWKIAGKYSAVGIEMATAVGIGTWVGNWLDGRFHTAPYCLLGGFLIGLGAAVKTILRIIREFRAQT